MESLREHPLVGAHCHSISPKLQELRSWPVAGFEAIRNRTFVRWVKFSAVGGIGGQLAALTIFRSWLKLEYLLATGLTVEIAVIHNFLWHERFTCLTG